MDEKLKQILGAFYSRGTAAEVLRKVAGYCESGHFPSDVTPFELGKAVARAMVNCPNGASLWMNLEEFTRGFRDGRGESGAQTL